MLKIFEHNWGVRSKTVLSNPISNEEEFGATNLQELDNKLCSKVQIEYPAGRALLLLEEVEQPRLQKRHLIRLSFIH